ncbi:MAG TPA: hypothetical protein DCY24_04285 [Rikenellaceae bacterium]|nr:hypothetical protein [Rikenellaceae bacterium]
MVSELIGKYIWLIQTLTAAGGGGLTFKELGEKYSRRFGMTYSRRTFNNHRLAVADLFGIDIDCDRRTNCYFIPYGGDVLDNEESIGWLVNTFTVNNLLSLSKERLSGRVSVEEIPSGQKYLTAIMQAMEDGKELEIVYGKYSSDSLETLHIQPLAVKEHEKRWYLVAFCHERAASGDSEAGNDDMNAWRVYGLDRICSLRVTGNSFKMPRNFDVDGIFSQSYGIYFPKAGQKPVTIRFKVTDEEARYIRDLPIHRSQAEEGKAEGGGRIFRIRVIPNKNLTMEFCRHAGRLEVLEPEAVRREVMEELEKAYKQYL